MSAKNSRSRGITARRVVAVVAAAAAVAVAAAAPAAAIPHNSDFKPHHTMDPYVKIDGLPHGFEVISLEEMERLKKGMNNQRLNDLGSIHRDWMKSGTWELNKRDAAWFRAGGVPVMEGAMDFRTAGAFACHKDPSRCTFNGVLQEAYPVVGQFGADQNNTKHNTTTKYTLSTRNEKSSTKSQGWTIGGEVSLTAGVGGGDKGGASVSGGPTVSFGYSNQTTDTTVSEGTSTLERDMTMSPGEEGAFDARFAGGTYVGYISVSQNMGTDVGDGAAFYRFPVKLKVKHPKSQSPVIFDRFTRPIK